MKVTVFGATGQIGRHVVTGLLAAGHDVTVYARNPAKLDIDDAHLAKVTGYLSDAAHIRHAVRGADAVISTLGPSLKRSARGTPVADGTKHIVDAMAAERVGRYVGLATPSVPDERDSPTLKARILPKLAGLMFPNALAEIIGMTAAVTQSNLNWTIARITSPNNGKRKGTVRAGYLGQTRVGSAMTRADIADFLVAQLTDDTYSRAAPAISN
jgi:nucleoside-diphosphate-sugar epimerase